MSDFKISNTFTKVTEFNRINNSGCLMVCHLKVSQNDVIDDYKINTHNGVINSKSYTVTNMAQDIITQI